MAKGVRPPLTLCPDSSGAVSYTPPTLPPNKDAEISLPCSLDYQNNHLHYIFISISLYPQSQSTYPYTPLILHTQKITYLSTNALNYLVTTHI